VERGQGRLGVPRALRLLAPRHLRIRIAQGGLRRRVGLALIIALACVSAAYVGGALAYSQKVHGAAALPHPVFWHEVRALVEDGLTYTKARALGGGGGGGGSGAEGSRGGAAYTAVPEVASASMAAAPGGSSDSDGDELVE
jgi:hypothetical protein